MDFQHIQDAQDYTQAHSHKVLDTFVAGFIGYGLFGSMFGFLETHAALFVGISAIIGGGLGLFRGYLAYREAREHYQDRVEKAAEKKLAQEKLRLIEEYALTDKEMLSRNEMAKIIADGTHAHKPLNKKK